MGDDAAKKAVEDQQKAADSAAKEKAVRDALFRERLVAEAQKRKDEQEGA